MFKIFSFVIIVNLISLYAYAAHTGERCRVARAKAVADRTSFTIICDNKTPSFSGDQPAYSIYDATGDVKNLLLQAETSKAVFDFKANGSFVYEVEIQ